MSKKLGKNNAKKTLLALEKIAFFNIPINELAELTPSVIRNDRYFYEFRGYHISILVTNKNVEVTVSGKEGIYSAIA